ncbi:MAG: DUF1559 domain-containing protein [Abitibacteriaceae bacterium]|nr:DUF1559 domain-containing protein [Abditibacteriaceae bacterium]MBV9867091.1 DUF1559 domain-containing protein [Abditibacteriaceae bacterium]
MLGASCNPRRNRRPQRSRAQSGFTLIELLVVIAIIAILAAILFPVFAKARENARRASCSNNEKQIGLGIMQYSQDYDETLPPYQESNGGGSWRQTIYPYIKSVDVFRCPSNSASKTITNNATATAPAMPVSYAASYHFFGNDPQRVQAIANVQSPSSKIMVAEQINVEDGIGAADWSTNTLFRDRGFAGHIGTANYLFGDGHVKAMRPNATMAGINMWGAWVDSNKSAPSCNAGGWNTNDDAWNPNCDDLSGNGSNALGQLANKYQ